MISMIVADFEQIVNDYERSLRNFARRIIANCEDVEEIVQDAFFRAHRALSRVSANERGGLPLKAWLYTITLNVARNRLRRKRPIFVSLETLKT